MPVSYLFSLRNKSNYKPLYVASPIGRTSAGRCSTRTTSSRSRTTGVPQGAQFVSTWRSRKHPTVASRRG